MNKKNKALVLSSAMVALGISLPTNNARSYRDGPCSECGKPDVRAGHKHGIYLCGKHIQNKDLVIPQIYNTIKKHEPDSMFYVYWKNAESESPMSKYSFDLEAIVELGYDQYRKNKKVWIENESGKVVYNFNF